MVKFQILLIRGGMTFKTREDYLNYLKEKEPMLNEKIRWHNRDKITKSLGKDFQVIIPRMPLMDNANYEDWKIVFENYFNAVNDNVILIGSSLGGIFLAKYLSENKVSRKILSVYLIAPPFDDDPALEEDLVGGFELGEDLSLIENNCNNVTLMFSKDDECVPVSHAEKYKEKLKNSRIVVYNGKNGHFQVSEFPEIIDMIREDVWKVKDSSD